MRKLLDRLVHIERDVMHTQAYGCWLCLHVGGTAIFFGRRKGYALRLELFTPLHRWRLSWRAALGMRKARRVSI